MVLLVVSALLGTNFAHASADDFDEYGIKNQEFVQSQLADEQVTERTTLSTSWLTMPTKSNVDVNKDWTITFVGNPVSLDKIAGIVIEKNGAFIPVKIRLFQAANQAVVTPLESYVPNETYTLRAFLENGQRYKMTFTTKSSITQNEQLGNTYGNISNYGYVAESDGWIYYRNQSDNGYLYKMKSDGSQNTSLIPDAKLQNISGLNVIGGWVYFSHNGYVYKVRTNGNNLVKITGIYAGNGRLIVTNNNIFVEGSSSIDKYYLDGELINFYTFSGSNYLVVNNLLLGIDYNEKLKTYDTNTSKTIYTSNERVSSLNVEGDWIFYINLEDYRIYKRKLDGSQKQKVNDDWTTYMNVYNGWVYYINDADQSVNKIKTDGTQKQQLTDDPGKLILTTKDWVFYFNANTNGMYKMKHDGSSWSKVQ